MNVPCHRLGNRFREHGDVITPPVPRARPVRDALTVVAQERFEEQPIQSARRAAVEIGYLFMKLFVSTRINLNLRLIE